MLKINVTKTDIDFATLINPMGSETCWRVTPVTAALSRKCRLAGIKTHLQTGYNGKRRLWSEVDVTGAGGAILSTLKIPKYAQKIISSWAKGNKIKPFVIEINVSSIAELAPPQRGVNANSSGNGGKQAAGPPKHLGGPLGLALGVVDGL